MLCWLAIGVTSIRFRAALERQNKTHLLTFRNWTYPYGPWLCVVANTILILVQGWSCFSPKFDVVSFISFYIEIPLMMVMFLAWKYFKKTKWVRLEDMDLVTDVYSSGEREDSDSGPRGKLKALLNWIF